MTTRKFIEDVVILIFLMLCSCSEDDGDGDGDGSLARPPMRLFGRVCSQLSFRSESDSDDSPCTELDDCDNVDCDEHVSSVPWDDARDEEEW